MGTGTVINTHTRHTRIGKNKNLNEKWCRVESKKNRSFTTNQHQNGDERKKKSLERHIILNLCNRTIPKWCVSCQACALLFCKNLKIRTQKFAAHKNKVVCVLKEEDLRPMRFLSCVQRRKKEEKEGKNCNLSRLPARKKWMIQYFLQYFS